MEGSGNDKGKKIFIVGGHLTPAIAVTDELLGRGYTNITWIGTKYTSRNKNQVSAEYEEVSKRNIEFIHLETGKLFRRWNKYTYKDAFLSLALIPIGFLKSLGIVSHYKPTVVFSVGGYLAVPIAISAWLHRIPVITHEQTLVSGLANEIIARFSREILISWPESEVNFSAKKVVLTGNPIPAVFHKVNKLPKARLFDNRKKTILVTGGNQGSHLLNMVLKESFDDLINRFNIIHQCGTTPGFNDLEELQNIADLSNKKKDKGTYLVYDYTLSEEYAKHIRFSDLVISRSGANTISVLLLYHKKAILIPIYKSSKGEQQANAEFYQKNETTVIINQQSLNKQNLLEAIKNIQTFKTDKSTSQSDNGFYKDAEKRIADIITKYTK